MITDPRLHPPTHGWTNENQHHLVAELARLQTLLERAAGTAWREDSGVAVPLEVDRADRHPPEEGAIDLLSATFGLSAFERDLLLLCAGPDLDAGFQATLTRTTQRAEPTFGLALATLPLAHWSALTPAGPLRRWHLLTIGAGPLTSAALRMDERVLHFLVGINELATPLEPLVRPAVPPDLVADEHVALASAVAADWADPEREIVALHGDDADGQADVAWHAAAQLGLELYTLRAGDVPSDPHERAELASLWTREAVLLGAALLLLTDDDAPPRHADLNGFLDRVGMPVAIAGPSPFPRATATRFAIHRPVAAAQRQLWETALGGPAWADAVDVVSGQLRLSALTIARVGAAVAADAAAGAPIDHGTIQRAVRRLAPAREVSDLIQIVEPSAGWKDLVLPQDRLDLLREISVHVRHRLRVYEEWGMGATGARGLGVAALFAGDSGTGKTMAAEVLARDLGLELYRIDLSTVVSKYIGETEKNLRRVFSAADEGSAILLFDEADALFGKRSEVRDSHDRYANIEVSYLLQQMETYRGLAVLTTNSRAALDRAFHRRLRFVVQFPFPDTAHREAIWRRVFPAGTPTADLDAARLARLSVSGGAIRNIALLGAFRAAAGGGPVRMSHLAWAARTELAKAERTVPEADLRGWT